MTNNPAISVLLLLSLLAPIVLAGPVPVPAPTQVIPASAASGPVPAPVELAAKAWILTVARNVLGDWRRRARLRQYVTLGTMHDLVYEAPSPEERLLREEEVGRLLDAVATLPEADRELIGLRYGSGLDTAEVAQILGITEGNVRTRVWRVLGRLRGVLAR